MKQQVFLGQVSVAGLLLTVSALFYSRVFGGPGWIAPVIGAVLLSGIISVGLGRTRMGRWLRAIALLLAGIFFVALAVILPGTNFGSGNEIATAFFEATVDGWRNSLAATLPIDTSLPAPLGFITAVGWIVGSATGVLVARSDQTASPIIPPVLFAALSLPLAAPSGVAAYVLIAALVGSALLLALVRAVPQAQISGPARDRVTEFVGERMLSERLIGGAPVLLLLALLTPLIALVLPFDSEEPFDPRRLRDEEVVTASAVNPLAEIKAKRESQESVFELVVPAAPSAGFFDRMPLVSLENYDGANWTTDGTYSATSADITPNIELNVDAIQAVRQQVEILDESSPWLPAAQPVTRIEGNDIWFDEDSGSLLDRTESSTRTYTVESRIAVPTDEDLRNAVVDRSDPRFVVLPPVNPDSPFDVLATRISGTNDYDRLVALEGFLREEFTFVTDGASGSALGRVEEFLIDGEGYRDQFVSAFAIAARRENFPTRITVGYRITEESEDTSVFLNTVTTEQYDAWPEVLFEGIGWVAFDPVPTVSGEAGANNDDATQIPEGQPAPQGPSPTASDPEQDDQLEDDEQLVSATVRLLVVGGIFFFLFPILLALIIIFAKLIRRRYRKNIENPTERVLAGWQESKDRLLEAGVEVRPDMTVKEIVSASRKELGVHASSSLSALAPYVTTTIYSERSPGDAAADQVWADVDTFDRQLSESRSRGQNIKAKVDPRPLLEKV